MILLAFPRLEMLYFWVLGVKKFTIKIKNLYLMKNQILLLTILGFLMLGCKKDDPCENITCLNGGTCANGACNCPTGYEGSDCSLQTTPTRINITSITVTDFPTSDVNGSSWDLSNGADIYVQLVLNGTLIAENEAQRILNATTTPIGWSSLPTTFELSEVTNQYTMKLYDSDDAFADDFIGEVYFTPYSNNNGFPTIANISCPGCNVAFQVTLDYDF